MIEYEDDNFLLHKFITLPKKHLESRLKEIEEQQIARKQFNDQFLTKLFTSKTKLKRLQHSLRYQPNDIQKQLIQLDLQIQKEKLSCLDDISQLTEKKNFIQNEISQSSIKLGMMKDELQ